MTIHNADLNDLLSSVINIASDDDDLSYQDPYLTREQKKRDRQITILLTEYVKSYQKKVKHSTWCRYIILVPCMAIIVMFAWLLVRLSLDLMSASGSLQMTDLTAFITACISFITLIIGLLTIITKYFFPENDEQYITTIVESIQKNDLDNKRENAENANKQTNHTENDLS